MKNEDKVNEKNKENNMLILLDNELAEIIEGVD